MFVLLTRMGLLKTATTSSSAFLSSKHNTSRGGVAGVTSGRDMEKVDNYRMDNTNNPTLSTLHGTDETKCTLTPHVLSVQGIVATNLYNPHSFHYTKDY